MADKNLFDYTEESIKSLDWKEHIRLRPVCILVNWAMAAVAG